MKSILIVLALIYGNLIALAIISMFFSIARILQNMADEGKQLRLIKGAK